MAAQRAIVGAARIISQKHTQDKTLLYQRHRALRAQKNLFTDEFEDTPYPREMSRSVANDDEIDFSKLLNVARRNWAYLLLGTLFGLAIGAAYILNTSRVYTSTVSISLDTVEAANVRELSGIYDAPLTESQVSTELEILRSEAIATKVVDRFEFWRSAEFMDRPRSALDRLTGVVRKLSATAMSSISSNVSDVPALPDAPEDVAARERLRAIGIIRGNMRVERLRDSRIVTISFRSTSAEMAARVANAIAETYIEDQLDSKFDSTQRATSWLKQRSDQLRTELGEIDNQIDRFRLDNNLLGSQAGSNLEDQLERIAMQLAAAEAELVTLLAKQRQLEDIIEQGDRTAAVSATATQGITNELRSRFLDILKDYNSLFERLGPDHEQTQRLSRELDQIQELMFEEIKRSERVTASDIATVMTRIAALREQKEEAERLYGAGSEVVLELRALEQNAETVRSLYTGFFQRYQELLQEQSFAVSDVRIINPAKVNSRPTSPNVRQIMVIGVFLGLMGAAALIIILEFHDNKIRTEDDIQSKLGIDFIAACSVLSTGKLFSRKRTQLPNPGDTSAVLPRLLRFGVDNPLSTFAESLRAVKLAVTLKLRNDVAEPEGVVVGMVSCFSGEGKTTISSNFASLLASQGKKVVLIDADLRNPELTTLLAFSKEPGLLQILLGEEDWQAAIRTNAETGLDIIPAGHGRATHSSELLSGENMGALLGALKQAYDFVIIDFPPLAPVIDARASLKYMDGVVFVIKWGKTKLSDAQVILQRDQRLMEKSIGAVLNFYDARRAAAYGSYASQYYTSGYRRYYDAS